MLKGLTLKFGAHRDADALAFEPGHMTVFVGPNNSGKSLILREIERYLREGGGSPYSILGQLSPVSMTTEEVRNLALSLPRYPTADMAPDDTKTVPKVESGRHQGFTLNVGHLLRTPAAQAVQQLAWLLTLSLDGATRLQLTAPQNRGDLTSPATSVVSALFRDDIARARVREILYSAFGLYFVIDPTGETQFKIRFSTRPPKDVREERGLDTDALQFHGSAREISTFSDGVRAFTGLVAAALATTYRVILIDEPEAFLHPPLVRKLGKTLTKLASERKGNVIAATHSADFIMGCIQAGVATNIIRLTFRDDVPTARRLPADQVQTLMRDPLLRSTGVLSALFYEGAFVCEGDSDRAFYQEINERLLAYSGAGAADAIFMNAQNKQTESRIVKPLREMGIPAAAIVDLDVIKEGGAVWSSLLDACFVPPTVIAGLGQMRGQINATFKAKEVDSKRVGLEALDAAERESAETLIATLASYGIFVVPRGELEHWLPELAVSANQKADWLVRIFERMGSDPADAGYVKPPPVVALDGALSAAANVWAFVAKIASWIADPQRKGVPLGQLPLAV